MLLVDRPVVTALAAALLEPTKLPVSMERVGTTEPMEMPMNLSLSIQFLPSLKEIGIVASIAAPNRFKDLKTLNSCSAWL